MIHLKCQTTQLSKVLAQWNSRSNTMDTTGSIRASLKGSSPGFHPQNIEPAVLDRAKQFLESLQFDLRIRQMLYPDKMEISLGKHVYYVLGNEQKYEPGYLICMKGQPLVFIHSRFQFGFTLRLRLHASLYQKEAVFVGTLDTVHAQLRLEDVLYYSGQNMVRDPYTRRYNVLKGFMENSFVQDKRLSGLTVSLAQPTPLASLKETIESGQFHSVDLIPEQGGRRRWYIPLHPQTPRAPRDTNPVIQKNTTVIPTVIPTVVETQATTVKNTSLARAIATKVTGLPDTYDLTDSTGQAIGRAAVQNAQISIELRQAITKPGVKRVPVRVEWYSDFERYQILGLDA